MVTDRTVDRDIFMRYLGGGVGHRATRKDVEHSRQNALRCGPAGGIHPTLGVDQDQDAGDESGVPSSSSTVLNVMYGRRVSKILENPQL